ncbi:Protein-lysine deacetylase [Mesoplasma sp. JKS002658]|uniref:dihydroxyacetone kinase phosphoryl donor subunit DhaM n=1 Tax=Mesoplasma whartonense TaxID=2878854 RepID=UPI002022B305|nr:MULTISPECIES: dihydroxyacetone kinase phosphoryl donor subunit DhaM [unclassified Mesoplasma]MCL8211218.1 Protein-lysine deacetylase [Mesoplasma sp. JKS002664]MCL8211879.1 Protein-lysine deacetylase [Mesoplasma sp. JKS002662]MCL8212890.1 Protein-lysine deacetylase [Mesoplasma sp. JKS002661]MCL8214016.1 Protein-lysine deacetylase [Mesoplasma sp. JKS002658]MCL8214556.1 Protein-lysine deacetylase [Mesoplasma sp. JKS002663]
MVSILVISHSYHVAKSVVELLGEMKSEPFKFDYLGGIEDHQAFGTDVLAIKNKIKAIDEGDGVLIIADMGSSIMNSQMVLTMLDESLAKRVKIANAPFFEAILASVVANQPQMSVDELLMVAQSTLNQKKF